MVIIFVWMALQLWVSFSGFYLESYTLPPRLIWFFLPPALAITLLFISKKGREFMDSIGLKELTLLHTIRIPVEIVLYNLFLSKVIPQIMTFEGLNFDILAGISAPFIYYYGFLKNKISNSIIICWNIISIFLLINIVGISILSARTPFQQFGMDQPIFAIAYFPFILLPGVIVPIVLLSHLITLRHLFLKLRTN